MTETEVKEMTENCYIKIDTDIWQQIDLIHEQNCYIKIDTDIWQQIDLIHEQNCSTGEIRLKLSPDFKEAVLLVIEKMKCCENCKKCRTGNCTEDSMFYARTTGKCDKWEMRE